MKRGGGGVEGRERVARGAAATNGLSSLSIEFPEVKGTAQIPQAMPGDGEMMARVLL